MQIPAYMHCMIILLQSKLVGTVANCVVITVSRPPMVSFIFKWCGSTAVLLSFVCRFLGGCCGYCVNGVMPGFVSKGGGGVTDTFTAGEPN